MRDEEIVALYWARNEIAIAETVKRFGAYLTKIAHNILGDPLDTEECVNDTYLKAWNSMPDNRPSVLSGYLARMVRHSALDLYRKKHAEKRAASEYALSLTELEELFGGHTDVEQQVDAAALRDTVNRFLRSLSPTARRVFIGRYYFFDSVRQIADDCGIAVGTVKSSLYRTRQALREYLIKEGFDL